MTTGNLSSRASQEMLHSSRSPQTPPQPNEPNDRVLPRIKKSKLHWRICLAQERIRHLPRCRSLLKLREPVIGLPHRSGPPLDGSSPRELEPPIFGTEVPPRTVRPVVWELFVSFFWPTDEIPQDPLAGRRVFTRRST